MASSLMIRSGSGVQLRSNNLPSGRIPNCLKNSLRIPTALEFDTDLRAAVGIQGRLSRVFPCKAADQAVLSSAESKSNAQLVKESWKLLRKDAGTHATNFFLKVFEIAPTVKNMFSFMKNTSLPAEKNPNLKSHALVVFSMTCEAAVLLGSDPTLESLRPKLLELGQSHVMHKVVDEHFDVVRYALLETLKDALKDKWSPEMKAAWAEAYDAVTKIILDEMHAVRRTEVAA